MLSSAEGRRKPAAGLDVLDALAPLPDARDVA
jgi:hypothetical protein